MNRTASSTLMTEGSIWKKIVTFAFPLFLGNLFQQLYNTADSLIVGNFLGSDALAAVSSSGSLIFLMVGFFNGIAMGAGVVVARYYGARQIDRLQRAIHTDVAFGIVAGILLTIIGLILAPQMLIWMGTPADVLPNSLLYFRIYFMGSLAFVLYNVFVGILQSIGDSRHPLNYLILSSIVNIVLDLFVCRRTQARRWKCCTRHDHFPVYQCPAVPAPPAEKSGGISSGSVPHPLRPDHVKADHFKRPARRSAKLHYRPGKCCCSV